MHLIYLDESGNTGCNLNDPQQPVFVLCALIVPETCWQVLERDLQVAIDEIIPGPLPDHFEIHGVDLRNGQGMFKGQSIELRLRLRDRWLKLAATHHLRLIYRAINKRRFKEWVENTFGAGVLINPHVAAFALVARVVNDYLAQLPDKPLGTFISDENLEVARDVEKSLQLLRGTKGVLRLSQIVEKGFFINSQKSLPLQLCDLCALTLRKSEEATSTNPLKPLDASVVPLIEPLIHRGNERFRDVIGWLTQERKKGATRD